MLSTKIRETIKLIESTINESSEYEVNKAPYGNSLTYNPPNKNREEGIEFVGGKKNKMDVLADANGDWGNIRGFVLVEYDGLWWVNDGVDPETGNEFTSEDLPPNAIVIGDREISVFITYYRRLMNKDGVSPEEQNEYLKDSGYNV